jgi:ankyrin repeat protein
MLRTWLLLGVLTAPLAAHDLELHEAIANDNLAKLQAALDRGADINAVPTEAPGGQPPLLMAILNDKLEFVKELVERGADTSLGEKDGYTPLHAAAFQGRADIMKYLLEKGLDPNDYHDDGFTPMHRALWGKEQRHTDTVRLLLEAGVDPKQPAYPKESQQKRPGQQQVQKVSILPMAIAERPETREVVREYLIKAVEAKMAKQKVEL